jgi:hypothetical protein
MMSKKKISYALREPELTSAQVEVIATLVQRRQYLIDTTNAQLKAIEAAFVEQERLIALSNGLPLDGKYDFAQRGDKLYLVVKKEPPAQPIRE